MSKPNLLYLSPVSPSPTGKGIAMRAYQNLSVLSEKYTVYLLILNYKFTEPKADPALEKICKEARYIPVKHDFFLLVKRLAYKISPSIYFSIFPHPSHWQHITSKQLKIVSKYFYNIHFDLIHIFRLYMYPFFEIFSRKNLNGHVQLDLDDIESITHKSISDLHRKNGDKKNAAFFLEDSKRYQILEKKWLSKFDRVFVCSIKDKKILTSNHSLQNISVLPNTIALPIENTQKKSEDLFKFLFIGSLDYLPNIDGVIYFCEVIIPEIRKRTNKKFELEVIGRIKDPKLNKKLSEIPEVNLLGLVEAIGKLYQDASVAIIPLQAGGGTRIKLLEAFAYKKAVVSTKIGAEGVDAKHGQHLLIANTPDEFARACVRLIADSKLRDRLAQEGFNLVLQRYTLDVVREILI